mgnify:CR=1 FL=1
MLFTLCFFLFLLKEVPSASPFALSVGHYSHGTTRQRGHRRQQRQQQQRGNHVLLFLESDKKASGATENLETPFSVSSSRGSKTIRKWNISAGKQTVWDSFKASVYGVVDDAGSITDILAAKGQEPGVEGGYSTIEKKILSTASSNRASLSASSPGQRLMDEYRARSSSSVPEQQQASGSQGSSFDAWKSTVYATVDAASRAFSTVSSFDDNQKNSFQSFKTVVQSTLSSSEIQEALPDLQSPNLIKRKLAESKIKNWEEKERKRERERRREEVARKFKESVYEVGDGAVWCAERLATLPAKVSYAAEGTGNLAKKVRESVDKVDGVVATVASLPGQVQSSVRIGLQSTKTAIEEVKELPIKVEKTMKETQKMVENAVATVDDVATSVKVRLELEKPKPSPPKAPPPSPPTAGEVGLKIAGSVAKGVSTGTAKFVWWVGKGAAVTAWNGVQKAFTENVASENREKSPSRAGTKPGKDVPNSPGAGANIISEVKEDENIATPMTSDEDVDKEVQEALLLAQSALDFADKSGPQSQPDDITDYSSMNMEMLKDELQKRGLKVSGQKAELIERLKSSS